METQQTLYICMGSACHQLGVYEVLPRLQELIRDYDLEDQIVIKGSFCLGACARGVVLKFDDTLILDVSVENVKEKFDQEVMARMKGTVLQ
jgi:NADH:ubiquinone oxidoreductase subunit E